MQMGFNNEFDYRDLRFHIQTEDRGLQAAKIESHIFHSGNILDTSVVSYEKIIDADLDEKERDSKIQSMMKANHRLLYQRLIQGEYDGYVGLSPSQKEDADVAVKPDEFAPSQDRVSEKLVLIEEGKLEPVDVAAQTEGVESIPLTSLRDKLDGSRPDSPPTPAPSANTNAKKRKTPPPFRKKTGENSSVEPVNPVFAIPDTGVTAFRGLVHKEPTLNVTELILAAL